MKSFVELFKLLEDDLVVDKIITGVNVFISSKKVIVSYTVLTPKNGGFSVLYKQSYFNIISPDYTDNSEADVQARVMMVLNNLSQILKNLEFRLENEIEGEFYLFTR